jgi:hypothetical protein
MRSLLLSLLVALAGAPAAPAVLDGHVTPPVGRIAPALGNVAWMQREGQAAPDLVALRGRVVIVQSYFYLCDT